MYIVFQMDFFIFAGQEELYTMDSDKKVFTAIIEGDRKAFGELFHKYYGVLCDYAYSYLNDVNESEDVVQDVFVYIWNNREVIRLNNSIKSYLFSSVKHGALNVLKHRIVKRKHSSLLLKFLEDLGREEYTEEETYQLRQVRSAIQRLSPQCRFIFIKSCLEGKKYKEIAEEMHISVNTVKSHISKANRIIQEYIGQSPSTSVSLLFLMIYRNLYFRLEKQKISLSI